MALFNGTDATDIIFGTGVVDTINGRGGDDQLFGEDGNDLIRGQLGNDFLRGGNGDDTILGGSGEDSLVGDHGNDTLNGGTGGGIFDYDIVRYDREDGGNGVTVDLKTGVATDTHGTTDTLIDIEAVRGTNFDDILRGGNVDNDDFENFRALDGNDLINGRTGIDRADYTADRFNGGDQGIVADIAAQTVRDGFGSTDTIRNIEIVRGTVYSDVMLGSDQAWERFEVLGGTDHVDGRGGTDEIAYHNNQWHQAFPGDFITGIDADLKKGEIIDTSGYYVDTVVNVENVRGSVLDDIIRGDDGINRLRGDQGDDVLRGRKGGDTLLGERGNDFMYGGRGADKMNGGSGVDVMRGGLGNDQFIFNAGFDHDTVVNFEDGADRLNFSSFGFASAADVLSKASQVGSDVEIDFEEDGLVTLTNFSLGDLTGADLII